MKKLMAHFQSITPEELKLYGGPILSAHPPYPPQIEGFASIRRDEYLSARSYAIAGLEDFDINATDIPTARNGAPVWPRGIVGSITHTRTQCIVALAAERHCTAVGIDLEVAGSVTRDLHQYVLTDDERHFVGDDKQQISTVIFSAKEAFYKLCRPAAYIDFLDVQVFVGVDDNSLQLEILRDSIDPKFASPSGLWSAHDGHVFTAFYK